MQFPEHKTSYVALGSNLGDSRAYLDKAVAALQLRKDIRALTVSRYYQSKPHGPQDQADYFNAVVRFETSLGPTALLDALQEIENNNQRVREGVVRWGARTLDLDLLFYADQLINTPRLIVPHSRICERAFVLFPLRDLDAHLDSLPNTALKKLNKSTIEECIELLPASDLNDIKVIQYD